MHLYGDTLFLVLMHLRTYDMGHVIMLSMVSKKYRLLIDKLDDYFFRDLLPIHSLKTNSRHMLRSSNLHGRSHAHIDLRVWSSLLTEIYQKISSPPQTMLGKTIAMHATIPEEGYDVLQWTVIDIDDYGYNIDAVRRDGHVTRGRIVLASKKVGQADNNEIKILTLEYAMLGLKRVSRRELVALSYLKKCMVCKHRPWSYMSASCPDRDRRKLCQACAYQMMVSPRNLLNLWYLPPPAMSTCYNNASLFTSVGFSSHAVWVSKESVEAYFGMPWSEIVKTTRERAFKLRRIRH